MRLVYNEEKIEEKIEKLKTIKSSNRLAYVIRDGKIQFIFVGKPQNNCEIEDSKINAGIIDLDTGGTEAEEEFWSLQQDTSMELIYDRKEMEK